MMLGSNVAVLIVFVYFALLIRYALKEGGKV